MDVEASFPILSKEKHRICVPVKMKRLVIFSGLPPSEGSERFRLVLNIGKKVTKLFRRIHITNITQIALFVNITIEIYKQEDMSERILF